MIENAILQRLMSLPMDTTFYVGYEHPSTLNLITIILNVFIPVITIGFFIVGVILLLGAISYLKDMKSDKSKSFSDFSMGLLLGLIFVILPSWGLLTPHNNEHMTFKVQQDGIMLRNNHVYAQTFLANDFVPYNDIVDIGIKPSTVQMSRGPGRETCIITFHLSDGRSPQMVVLSSGMNSINLIPCHYQTDNK